MRLQPPSLSRPMDWSYLSNRFVVVATPVVGTIAGVAALISGESLWDSAWWGYFAAGASFLAWTVARELHPDRAWLATVAMVIAPVGLVWGRADLLASATVLLVARTVAGTTGRSLRHSDLLLLAAVGLPLVVRGSGPGALAAGAIGLAMTIPWHERRRTVHVAAAGLYALGAITAIALSDGFSVSEADGMVLVWVGLVAGAITLLGPGHIATIEDRRGGGELRRPRVAAARGVALTTAAVVSVTFDPAAMAPVWAAVVATAIRPR